MISGVVGTVAGFSELLHHAQRPEIFSDHDYYRGVLTEGPREAIGNVITGGSLTIAQLFAWAIARRRVELS